jgi:pimeloyl-ACP methyl ester carboxylesterase
VRIEPSGSRTAETSEPATSLGQTSAPPGRTAQTSEPAIRLIESGDVTLAVEDTGGDGRPVVLAHGLTATRRYVVHGSRLLARSGYRVVSYDARGHGESSPAPDPAAYRYSDLVADLGAVLDGMAIREAVLAGASMGAATTLAFALESPERVSALVQITPAQLPSSVMPYGGEGSDLGSSDAREVQDLRRWDALADALEQDGVEGFLRAYGDPPIAERFRGVVLRAIAQRLERHHHPDAVAAALRAVPRSSPFEQRGDLSRLGMPVLIVASRDDADPGHPYEVAETYAALIAGAELVSEEPGQSPLAWRGAHLSRAIINFLERHGLEP